jgi:peptidoglycan/xylan/chitin deacetylase (PgdA/CDA1 family)
MTRGFGHDRPVILMYHRIADPDIDPWSLCVTPAHFAEHLDVISRSAAARPLADVQGEIVLGTESSSVAVTFDDGYADNLVNALPLLARFNVPATVFVTTGYIGGERSFWWDTLARIMLGTHPLPPALEVRIGGQLHAFDAGQPAEADRSDATHRSWRAYATDPPTSRHTAFLAIWERLAPADDSERADVLAALEEQVSVRAAEIPDDTRTLTRDEVVQLADHDLIEIGAHSVTHPPLPAIPASRSAPEIRESRTFLTALTGKPVHGFSYPHGRYSTETVEQVRDAGFRYACVATPTPPAAMPDPLLLPRVPVPDCGGEELLRLLHGAAGGA